MGKMQRAKGARVERELVNLLREKGFAAQRVPLSGATTFCKGDVELIDISMNKFYIEVKSRKDGFINLYKEVTTYGPVRFSDCIASDDICEVLTHSLLRHRPSPPYLETLKKLKVNCDILAVKANGKPFLYLRWFE